MPIFAEGSSAYITPDDLAPFAEIPEAKALAMIEDALAKAARVAPCLAETEFQDDEANVAAVRSVLRTAILRRNDAGSGAHQQQVAGSYSVSYDTRQPHRSLFWPSEIDELQSICRAYNGEGKSGAFSVDTAGVSLAIHADWCALYFGANYCSCGADIAGYPIFEQPA